MGDACQTLARIFCTVVNRPDYIIQNQLIFVPYIGKVVTKPWFKQEYREVTRIDEPGYPPLIIYQRLFF